MDVLRRLTQIFESAKVIPFDDSSRIVLMSDCHRGDGSWNDDFSRNQHLYFAALMHYNKEQYTYIELGDGEELWENNKLYDITHEHSDAYWLISKFYREGRFYSLYGNHDIVKRSERYTKSNFYTYFDEREKRDIPLLDGIKFHEALVLKHRVSGEKIFLIHGHQADFMNYQLWRISKLLVKYLWKPLEFFGVNDPTRTAKNYKKKEKVGRELLDWAFIKKQILIAGHTHRPVFPEVGEPLYFNDGSCVHPRCITAMEIRDGCIMLVKWHVKTKEDGSLFVAREILAGPGKLKDYFNAKAVRRKDLTPV